MQSEAQRHMFWGGGLRQDEEIFINFGDAVVGGDELDLFLSLPSLYTHKLYEDIRRAETRRRRRATLHPPRQVAKKKNPNFVLAYFPFAGVCM